MPLPRPHDCLLNPAIRIMTCVLATFLLILSAAFAQSPETDPPGPTEAQAQYDLGIRFIQEGPQAPNYVEAAKWFRRAAEQGHPAAQYSFGLRYLFGQGVAKDPQAAIYWLQRSAEQGFAAAEFSLGLRFYWGQGVRKDLQQARDWFEKAARQGHAKAKRYLTELQAQPPSPPAALGLPPDSAQLVEAYARASSAASAEDGDAAETRQKLGQDMSASEILRAIQLVAKQRPASPPEEPQPNAPLLSAEDYFQTGNRLISSGQLQAAISAYQNALVIAPENANTLSNLATAFANGGENQKAIENLEKAIALAPGQASRHATLGMLYQVIGDRQAALAAYRNAASLDPGLGWIYPDMAVLFSAQKNFTAARQALHQAQLLGHGNPRLSAHLTRVAPETSASKEDRQPATLHLRQLVLPSRAEAEVALQQLRSGKDFSQLAQKLSSKPSSRNGGYWGPYQTEQLAEPFSKRLKDLPPLAFSSVIESEAGYHILQLFPVYNSLLEQN